MTRATYNLGVNTDAQAAGFSPLLVRRLRRLRWALGIPAGPTLQANMNARCSLSSKKALATRLAVRPAGSVRRLCAWAGSSPSVALGSPSAVAVRSSARLAQSGRQRFLAAAPHTTHRAGPQWAVHAKFDTHPHGLRSRCVQSRQHGPTPNSTGPVGLERRGSSHPLLRSASHVRPFVVGHSREAPNHYYGVC